MLNQFSLFSFRPHRRKNPTIVPPDLAIALVRNYSKSIQDFNDEPDLLTTVDRFADELGQVAEIQENLTYEEAVTLLRRLEEGNE